MHGCLNPIQYFPSLLYLFYHFLSHNDLFCLFLVIFHPVLSCPITPLPFYSFLPFLYSILSYPYLSHSILSFSIPHSPFISYPLLSNPILFGLFLPFYHISCRLYQYWPVQSFDSKDNSYILSLRHHQFILIIRYLSLFILGFRALPSNWRAVFERKLHLEAWR